MRARELVVLAVLFPALALGAAACGGGGSGSGAKPTAAQLEADEDRVAGGSHPLAAHDAACARRPLPRLRDRRLGGRPEPVRLGLVDQADHVRRPDLDVLRQAPPARPGAAAVRTVAGLRARGVQVAERGDRPGQPGRRRPAPRDCRSTRSTRSATRPSCSPPARPSSRPPSTRSTLLPPDRSEAHDYRQGMALSPEFRAAVAQALPADALIVEPEQLRTYECDALTGHRAVPDLVVLARSAAEVQAVVRLCHEHRVPFVARGAGTGLSGGALPVADGVVISLTRLNRVARGRSRPRPRRRRAGRDQPRHHARGRRGGLLLRPRPVEPAGLHDRRQRRRELGRRPLPQARVHRQPRPRGRRRSPRRRARHPLARRRGPRPARRVRRLRGDARDRRPDHRARAAGPRGRADAPRRLRLDGCRRRRRLARDRRGDPAGRDRDDGRADDRGGRGRCRTRATRRARARC